jgi:hypothetical protein
MFARLRARGAIWGKVRALARKLNAWYKRRPPAPPVRMSRARNLAFLGVFSVLIGLLAAFALGLFSVDQHVVFLRVDNADERLGRIGNYLESLVSSADQLFSFLLTVQLGLFVALGYTLHSSALTSPVQIALCFCFLVSAFISGYLGYLGRLQLFDLINSAQVEFHPVELTIGRQALWVGLSAVFAFSAIALSFLRAPAGHPRPADAEVPRSVLAADPDGPPLPKVLVSEPETPSSIDPDPAPVGVRAATGNGRTADASQDNVAAGRDRPPAASVPRPDAS